MIFETTEFSFDTLSQRLRELAFLNKGLLITIDDERDGEETRVSLHRRNHLFRRASQQEQDATARQGHLLSGGPRRDRS